MPFGFTVTSSTTEEATFVDSKWVDSLTMNTLGRVYTHVESASYYSQFPGTKTLAESDITTLSALATYTGNVATSAYWYAAGINPAMLGDVPIHTPASAYGISSWSGRIHMGCYAQASFGELVDGPQSVVNFLKWNGTTYDEVGAQVTPVTPGVSHVTGIISIPITDAGNGSEYIYKEWTEATFASPNYTMHLGGALLDPATMTVGAPSLAFTDIVETSLARLAQHVAVELHNGGVHSGTILLARYKRLNSDSLGLKVALYQSAFGTLFASPAIDMTIAEAEALFGLANISSSESISIHGLFLESDGYGLLMTARDNLAGQTSAVYYNISTQSVIWSKIAYTTSGPVNNTLVTRYRLDLDDQPSHFLLPTISETHFVSRATGATLDNTALPMLGSHSVDYTGSFPRMIFVIGSSPFWLSRLDYSPYPSDPTYGPYTDPGSALILRNGPVNRIMNNNVTRIQDALTELVDSTPVGEDVPRLVIDLNGHSLLNLADNSSGNAPARRA